VTLTSDRLRLEQDREVWRHFSPDTVNEAFRLGTKPDLTFPVLLAAEALPPCASGIPLVTPGGDLSGELRTQAQRPVQPVRIFGQQTLVIPQGHGDGVVGHEPDRCAADLVRLFFVIVV